MQRKSDLTQICQCEGRALCTSESFSEILGILRPYFENSERGLFSEHPKNLFKF